ncbi:hypothetical protein Tsp_04352 [Trichinella spiralis]|uniref:hypothetical protein n=1 Tax=Trichinella spiralis TaxID=6334 RepID=UPI0001EFC510|nr:hypothetical protein Tsp_04352 [Trichinella spiralis]
MQIVENVCSHFDSPSAENFFQAIDRTSMMLILLTFLASAFIVICFAISLHFIIKYVSSIEQRWRMIWLLQIFLAISVCSCVGMCVPRAIAVCEIMMLFSFSQCLFKYVRFIVGCFDGEENMTFRLEGDYINYREPELCCICCPCLPVKVITKSNSSNTLVDLSKRNSTSDFLYFGFVGEIGQIRRSHQYFGKIF